MRGTPCQELFTESDVIGRITSEYLTSVTFSSPADGVALGAAASTSQTSVQLIVFVAIMLHKVRGKRSPAGSDQVPEGLLALLPCRLQAPAAFGLVSFLMHAGLERNRIRKHLLVFALAAPALAMITFLGLSQVTNKSGSTCMQMIPLLKSIKNVQFPSILNCFVFKNVILFIYQVLLIFKSVKVCGPLYHEKEKK